MSPNKIREEPFPFTNKKEFDELLSHVHHDPYTEFERISNMFSKIILSNGPNSFSTTIVVYNTMRALVGILACRPTADKPDLYKAMAQMLYFPMSLSSELFIVAQDTTMKSCNPEDLSVEEKTDALVITYVTPRDCVFFTIPYKIDSKNIVSFNLSKAYLYCVHQKKEAEKSGPIGDMSSLFYIFSHSVTTGPFLPDEVLAFLKINNFNFEIINPQNMTKSHIALPIAM